MTHTIRLADGSKLPIHDSNLQLLDQPDFSNIPNTPLEYRNEVGVGLSLEEAQNLVMTARVMLGWVDPTELASAEVEEIDEEEAEA